MEFRTEVELEVDYSTMDQKLTISWMADIESRSWGIKQISPSVPSQILTFRKPVYDIDGDEIGERVFKVTPSKIEIEYENGQNSSGCMLGVGLYPIRVELNTETEEAVVFFAGLCA